MDVTDVLVIGAGPHALSFLAHFIEDFDQWDRYWESPENPVLFSRHAVVVGNNEWRVSAHRKQARMNPQRSHRSIAKHLKQHLVASNATGKIQFVADAPGFAVNAASASRPPITVRVLKKIPPHARPLI